MHCESNTTKKITIGRGMGWGAIRCAVLNFIFKKNRVWHKRLDGVNRLHHAASDISFTSVVKIQEKDNIYDK